MSGGHDLKGHLKYIFFTGFWDFHKLCMSVCLGMTYALIEEYRTQYLHIQIFYLNSISSLHNNFVGLNNSNDLFNVIKNRVSLLLPVKRVVASY